MISVIIPVYNCDKYLDNCIHSLIGQSIFEQLEIIFVNDGSTDNSETIVSSYVNQYANMFLISQKNAGVSAARNRGIQEANGEYIAFLDADDELSFNIYEYMLSMMENSKVDLCCVNYSTVFPDGKRKMHKKKKATILKAEQIMVSFFYGGLLGINVFDKLFKTTLVKQICFPDGYAIGEDMFFVYRYLKLSRKVNVDTTVSLYDYFIHDGSAMQSKFCDKYFQPVILSEMIMKDNEGEDLFIYAEANYFHEACKMLALYYKCEDEGKKYLHQITAYRKKLKDYPLKKAYKYLNPKHFIAYLIMRISPYIYVKTYKLLHIG